MSLSQKRSSYVGVGNTVAAFTVPASKQWLVNNLIKRISVDSGTPTVLQIEHRDSGGNILAILSRDTSFGVDAKATDETNWNGAILEAGDTVHLTGGDAGSTIEVMICYEEQG